MKNWIKQTCLGLFIVWVLWFMLFMLLKTPIIPSPWLTFKNTLRILPELLLHLAYSFYRIMIALLLSSVFGTGLGLWMATSKKANQIFSPVLYILNPLPKIAFLPIFMVLFGLGEVPKIMVIVSVIIFQFTFAAQESIVSIPKEMRMSFNSLNPSRYDRLVHLYIPSILPQWFTALKIGFGVSVSVLFFGETFKTRYGLGYFIMSRWDVVNYLDMYSGIVILGLFGLLVYGFIDLIQRRVCNWLYLK